MLCSSLCQVLFLLCLLSVCVPSSLREPRLQGCASFVCIQWDSSLAVVLLALLHKLHIPPGPALIITTLTPHQTLCPISNQCLRDTLNPQKKWYNFHKHGSFPLASMSDTKPALNKKSSMSEQKLWTIDFFFLPFL